MDDFWVFGVGARGGRSVQKPSKRKKEPMTDVISCQPRKKVRKQLDAETMLDRLAQRMRKNVKNRRQHQESVGRRSTSTRQYSVQPYTAPLKTPIEDYRPMPKIAPLIDRRSSMMDEDRKSVVRIIVDALDQNALSEILPMRKFQNLDETGYQPEVYPDLDSDTETKLNERFNQEIELRARNRQFETLSTEGVEIDRPKSPGHEYDAQYVHAETGMREPRFRADVQEMMFRSKRIPKKKLLTLMTHARDVEKDLNNHYQKHTCIATIKRNMINQARKQRSVKKKLRTLSS